MSRVLILTGLVMATVNKKSFKLGAGTDISRIDLPDKKYGLTDKDVERIVRSGVGSIEDSDVSQETHDSTVMDDGRLAVLLDAVGQLEEGNQDHWTSDNKPDIAALKEITGTKVTANERDYVWERAQQG
ncbi:MAG: hypothetical protein RPU60_04045 [Candidatus Sedimenticola sp. (ex Thyasira tokunagai)]